MESNKILKSIIALDEMAERLGIQDQAEYKAALEDAYKEYKEMKQKEDAADVGE